MTTTTENETYQIGNVKYHAKFPKGWAENHLEETGPEECENCPYYGSLSGVFIGYCGKCADQVYGGTRGRGLWEGGIECNSHWESIYDTYLFGYTLDIDATRLVPINDPKAMTEEQLGTYIKKINEEHDMYQTSIDDDESYEYDTNLSVMNCHFEGGYNDM